MDDSLPRPLGGFPNVQHLTEKPNWKTHSSEFALFIYTTSKHHPVEFLKVGFVFDRAYVSENSFLEMKN